ncbi:hypothetical protein SAMN05216264_110161 [Pseudomonas marincola]|nr:hypothetical protein SAMN05216264_110161 [Pseudomonas marincola]
MTHRFITTLLRIVEKPGTSKRDTLTTVNNHQK